MMETDFDFRVKELTEKVEQLESTIEVLKARSTGDDLWDNSDMMLNWKVSQRTLASWRADGLIDYVQVGGKIWYTKENRNNFLMRNAVQAKQMDLTTCSN
jgi:hypothetical protein